MTVRKGILASIAVWAGLGVGSAAEPLVAIAIDYPLAGSIFPPEIAPPTFLWRDPAAGAAFWRIEVVFSGGALPLHAASQGERMRIGEIDPRCVSPTNRPPQLTPEQAAAHTWTPDPDTWAAIKRGSLGRPATVTVTGHAGEPFSKPLSRGRVTFETSPDPVGAPVFYRDVPLMPSELQKGVIKPLSESALPLVGWRLRDIARPASRLVLEGLYTCANCHSFSADGKTLGLDLDGPRSDKGMYAIVPVAPQISIRNQDVVTWSGFQNPQGVPLRIGFMSQVSPDGRYVATTINGMPGGHPAQPEVQSNYYVANFKDYRFLQVFYPTRGVLAWYDRAAGRLQPLPGADDPRYVHTGAVWSPDGQYLVFSRAAARDPYSKTGKLAEYANDLSETPMRYDLYRIPFNGGKGGTAEPIAGASHNGMSNSFAKVSPDGHWIVFVRARNGLLMRPDSQLYTVPAAGGEARRMTCNTPLMNSWHSFSPNGRWMVFSSKSRSPYTQMFLTHIDREGRDSPAVLIENSTAANRAVNIPEFVNIPPDGMVKIEAPAADFYRLFDRAWELAEKGRNDDAIAAWRQALQLSPEDGRANYNLGVALAHAGDFPTAIRHYEAALRANPGFGDVHNNLAVALARTGRIDEAIGHYREALESGADRAEVRTNLGVALVWKKRSDEAIAEFRKALEIDPGFVEARRNLGDAYYYLQGKPREAIAEWRQVLRAMPGHVAVLTETAWLLATCPTASVRNGAEAVRLAEQAVQRSGGREPDALDALAAAYAEIGRYPDALRVARQASSLLTDPSQRALAEALRSRIALYEAGRPYRDTGK